MTLEPRPIKAGLVQINNAFANACYFPYSTGLLQAYAAKHAKHPEAFEFIEPVFRRCEVAHAAAHLAQADIVGFSVYVWNYNLSLAIAREVKRERPDVLIVFGGPHVPDRAEAFLRDKAFVDLACHGEGESTFLRILESCPSREWYDIPSISYIDRKDRFVQQPRPEAVRDLSTIPSPYLEGVFDPLMAKYPGTQWVGLWETNRGCPFSCAYCDWGLATKSRLVGFDMERLRQEIEWFAAAKTEFIFCCDANFGIMGRDIDIVRLVAETKRRLGYPRALSVQNTKNATERSYLVQKTLAEAGLSKGVNLALQSIDPTALEHVRRERISLDSFHELQRRFNRDGIETFTDLILALPGETYDSFTNGVARIIENGQHNRIQFNNLCILPNAEMGDRAYQERHGLVLVESKIINIHGSRSGSEDGIEESQILVVGTNSMPEEDWVRTRAFSWMTALLHFDKLLQVPFVVLHELCGVSYTDLVGAFLCVPEDGYPILSGIRDFFYEEARNVQRGGTEYYPAPEWLDIYWPHDEYIFINLLAEGHLEAFGSEAERVLSGLLRRKSVDIPPFLGEVIRLNQQLIAKPFQSEDLVVEYGHDFWGFYRAVLSDRERTLMEGKARYCIDRTSQVWRAWDEWAREVVWYGNKKGAYLYNMKWTEADPTEGAADLGRSRPLPPAATERG